MTLWWQSVGKCLIGILRFLRARRLRQPRSRQSEWASQLTFPPGYFLPSAVLLHTCTWWHEAAEGKGGEKRRPFHPQGGRDLFILSVSQARGNGCPPVIPIDRTIRYSSPYTGSKDAYSVCASYSLAVFITLPRLREPSACIKVTSDSETAISAQL